MLDLPGRENSFPAEGLAGKRQGKCFRQRCASFETAAAQLPQDEGLLGAIKRLPHPEEAAKRPSRRTHGRDAANSLTGSKAGAKWRIHTMSIERDLDAKMAP
jgi:hypothetical protein